MSCGVHARKVQADQSKMKIDTERVIVEVHLRPCLWDKSHELYKNRDARDAAWKEILMELAPNFESLSDEQKKNADKKIQQRWRTARDTYSKEKSSEKKQPSGSGSQKKKKYSFYDMLTFLDKTTDIDADESLFGEETQDNSLQSGNMNSQPSSTNQLPGSIIDPIREQSTAGTQPSISEAQRINQQPLHSTRQQKLTKPKNKRGNSEFETELLQYLQTSELEIAKDDLAFYKSIQPTLNGFNSYQKLMFRTKVLNLLMEMTQQFQSLNYLNQQQSISTSSNTNYDSMSPLSAELSDHTNQSNQNIQNNLVEVNETDRDGASAPETGTVPRPVEGFSHVYLDSLLNQTLQNTSDSDENGIFPATMDGDENSIFPATMDGDENSIFPATMDTTPSGPDNQ